MTAVSRLTYFLVLEDILGARAWSNLGMFSASLLIGSSSVELIRTTFEERGTREGWGAVRLDIEKLMKVLRNFDLVSVNPWPDPSTDEYLYSVEVLVRTLREPE